MKINNLRFGYGSVANAGWAVVTYMPAKSVRQQQAAAIALHHPGKARTGMGDMAKKDLRKFASTKHKGLPQKTDEDVEERANQLVDELLES